MHKLKLGKVGFLYGEYMLLGSIIFMVIMDLLARIALDKLGVRVLLVYPIDRRSSHLFDRNCTCEKRPIYYVRYGRNGCATSCGDEPCLEKAKEIARHRELSVYRKPLNKLRGGKMEKAEEKWVVIPLNKTDLQKCYNCGDKAICKVPKPDGEKYSCSKQVCLVPLVFPVRQ